MCVLQKSDREVRHSRRTMLPHAVNNGVSLRPPPQQQKENRSPSPDPSSKSNMSKMHVPTSSRQHAVSKSVENESNHKYGVNHNNNQPDAMPPPRAPPRK